MSPSQCRMCMPSSYWSTSRRLLTRTSAPYQTTFSESMSLAGIGWPLGARTSFVWESPYFRNLSGQISAKALCDLCMYGHATRAPTTLVGTFTSIRRMRWSCDQHHFRHVHTGRPGQFACPLFSSSTWLLSSFMRFSPSPTVSRTPVILPESALRHLPCYAVAQRNSLPTGAVAPFVVCKDRVQSDYILTAIARSTSSCSLPVPSPLCRDAPSSLPLTAFTSPLSTTPPPRAFLSFHSWKNPDRKREAGAPVRQPGERRLATGCWAVAAGRQTRRTAHAPLLQCEPGESIAFLSVANHPFTEEAPVPDDLAESMRFLQQPLRDIRRQRAHWCTVGKFVLKSFARSLLA